MEGWHYTICNRKFGLEQKCERRKRRCQRVEIAFQKVREDEEEYCSISEYQPEVFISFSLSFSSWLIFLTSDKGKEVIGRVHKPPRGLCTAND
jgi:hypothetical protein